jgi:ATP-dependent Clp protease protease subunit
MDSEREITMYINSPGGSTVAMAAIYDTMQYIGPEIQTVCLGLAASAAAVILTAGAKGKRLALPNSKVLIHQPAIGQVYRGSSSDLEIRANEMVKMREWLETTLAERTGHPVEKIQKDIERDKFLTAQEALEYGLIDQVLKSRKNQS